MYVPVMFAVSDPHLSANCAANRARFRLRSHLASLISLLCSLVPSAADYHSNSMGGCQTKQDAVEEQKLLEAELEKLSSDEKAVHDLLTSCQVRHPPIFPCSC